MAEPINRFKLAFQIDPGLIPGTNLSRPMRTAGRPILDFITSQFPPGNFRLARSRNGKPWGGCNSYVFGETRVGIFVIVYDERASDGWLDCEIWAFSRQVGLLRRRHSTEQIDIQAVAALREKIDALFSSIPGIRTKQIGQAGG